MRITARIQQTMNAMFEWTILCLYEAVEERHDEGPKRIR